MTYKFTNLTPVTQKKNSTHKYLTRNDPSNSWGIYCTTAGFQKVPPHAIYPMQQHPQHYLFNKQKGRILDEYQLVYITHGQGILITADKKEQIIYPGSLLFLSPGLWHSYYPDPEVGWNEFWVGFSGEGMDQLVRSGYFQRDALLIKFGIHNRLVDFFEEIYQVAEVEQSGFQQYLAGIIYNMLGYIYYKNKNALYIDNPVVEKIREAKKLMQDSLDENPSPFEISEKLGMGYSWFRRNFKEYVGISPGQYQLQLKHLRAKELLRDTPLSISEISFELGFDNLSQFSIFFRKYEGVSAREYRNNNIESSILHTL